MTEGLLITRTEEKNETTLHLHGRVDTDTSEQLLEQVREVYDHPPGGLVLDFAGVDYLNSAGMRVLMFGQKTAVTQRRRMTLVNVQMQIRAVLDSVGLGKAFEIL